MSEAKQDQHLFDGQGVIRFEKEVDRRNFLRYAGIVGVGTSLVLAGVSCTTRDEPRTRSAAVSPPDTTEDNPDLGIPQRTLRLMTAAMSPKEISPKVVDSGS